MVVLQVLKDFAGATSIHGLGFIVNTRLSSFERVAWSLIFTAAIMWASIQLQFAVTSKLRVPYARIYGFFRILEKTSSELICTQLCKNSNMPSIFGSHCALVRVEMTLLENIYSRSCSQGVTQKWRKMILLSKLTLYSICVLHARSWIIIWSRSL